MSGIKSDMSVKERLLGAIRGNEIDRVPWSPFLAYYFDMLPANVREKGQYEYLREMGADPLLRGSHMLYYFKHHNCEVRSTQNGNTREEIFDTPVGSLRIYYTYSDRADSWFLTGHPLKEEEDFKILQYVYENIEVLPCHDDFNREYRRLGDNALLIPCVFKTAFQDMLEHWCGTVELVYALADYPDTVEACLNAMQARNMEGVRISADNRLADGFISWEDTSTTNISPALFEKYIGTEIHSWTRTFHDAGKFYIHHACGHLKDLLPLMAETEIDMVESISPPPTGNIEIADAVKLLPDNIGIIGGIEPTFFRNCSENELDECVRGLLKTMEGKRFVLANSDSCPPDVPYSNFLRVRDMIRIYGRNAALIKLSV